VYTLDTNAVIYFLKDEERAAQVISDILAEPSTSSYISTATEAELFAYSNLADAEISRIEEFFELVTIIPIDSRVARLAGSLKALHDMKLGDSLVAATALLMRSTLLTRNVKNFKKIPR
jgi:predicted nucleic acid-binding protein